MNYRQHYLIWQNTWELSLVDRSSTPPHLAAICSTGLKCNEFCSTVNNILTHLIQGHQWCQFIDLFCLKSHWLCRLSTHYLSQIKYLSAVNQLFSITKSLTGCHNLVSNCSNLLALTLGQPQLEFPSAVTIDQPSVYQRSISFNHLSPLVIW